MSTVLHAPIDLIKNATTVLLTPIALLKNLEALNDKVCAATFEIGPSFLICGAGVNRSLGSGQSIDVPITRGYGGSWRQVGYFSGQTFSKRASRSPCVVWRFPNSLLQGGGRVLFLVSELKKAHVELKKGTCRTKKPEFLRNPSTFRRKHCRFSPNF